MSTSGPTRRQKILKRFSAAVTAAAIVSLVIRIFLDIGNGFTPLSVPILVYGSLVLLLVLIAYSSLNVKLSWIPDAIVTVSAGGIAAILLALPILIDQQLYPDAAGSLTVSLLILALDHMLASRIVRRAAELKADADVRLLIARVDALRTLVEDRANLEHASTVVKGSKIRQAIRVLIN